MYGEMGVGILASKRVRVRIIINNYIGPLGGILRKWEKDICLYDIGRILLATLENSSRRSGYLKAEKVL